MSHAPAAAGPAAPAGGPGQLVDVRTCWDRSNDASQRVLSMLQALHDELLNIPAAEHLCAHVLAIEDAFGDREIAGAEAAQYLEAWSRNGGRLPDDRA